MHDTHPDETAAIRARLDAYLDAFQALSVERAMAFYRTPGFVLTPAFRVALGAPEQVRDFLGATFAQMRAQGYAGSRWGAMHVHVFFPTAALVSAVWERCDRDGAVLGRSATTYQMARIDGEWFVVSAVMHDEATLLR